MNERELNITLRAFAKDGGFFIEARSKYEDGMSAAISDLLAGDDATQVLRDNPDIVEQKLGAVARMALSPKYDENDLPYPD